MDDIQQVLDYHDPCHTVIDYKFQVPLLPRIFTNYSSQYDDPVDQGLGFFSYYRDRELFLDLVIPIIKDLLYFLHFSRLWN